MDIVLSISVIASFLAGLVALMAPCCVTVVLPTYLAAVLKRRSKIVAMTLVYFLGLAFVLVPIILGVAWLADILREWHSQLYIGGGIMMFILAIGAIIGIKLPTWTNGKKGAVIDPGQPGAVFMLGVFSGAATACCAPVLLGAATLSILTGSFWQAILVSLSYVAGIVFPLFVAAVFYDRFNLSEWLFKLDKQIEIKLPGRIIRTRRMTLWAAGIFALMGVIFLYVGLMQNGYWSPEWQAALGENLNNWSINMVEQLEFIPDWIFGLGVVIGIATMIWLSGWLGNNRDKKKYKTELENEKDNYKNNNCH